ncbi:MAG: hypothetical protein KC619_20295, partial [Myxococcales bacterium]|nr:hypothetical protein [Myxococcales bacterium]
LEAIILKCLAKKPSSRYQTMADLKADLDALAKGMTPTAVISEIDRSLPPKPEEPFEHAPSVVPGQPPTTTPPTTVPPVEQKGISGLTIALIVIPILAAGAFGVTYFVMPGDTSTPTGPIAANPDPPEDPTENPTPNDTPPDTPDGPDQVGEDVEPPEDPQPDQGNSPENTSVVLNTEPAGAEVFGPDGSLVGNTPVTIVKPRQGEPAIEYRIHLSGYAERTFTVGAMTQPEVMLTMDTSRRGTGSTRRGSSTTTTPTTNPNPPADPLIHTTTQRNPPRDPPRDPATNPPRDPNAPSLDDLRRPF